MMNLLEINKLNFSYKNNKIFHDLSFSIEKNTINALLSPNNCGKTTLIKILSGNLQYNGDIQLDGVTLNKENKSNYIKNIGIVLSRVNLNIKNNNVKYLFQNYLHKLNYTKTQIKNILVQIDTLYNIENLYRKKIINLSKFEKIKILILLSILHNPKLLLLDDVYDDLNNNECEEIYLLLKKIVKEKEITVLYTTTKLDMCINSDKIIFLNEGKIQLEGDFDYISNHDNVLVRNGIDISIMLDLSLKLKFYNLVDNVILEPDRMVDRLWQ